MTDKLNSYLFCMSITNHFALHAKLNIVKHSFERLYCELYLLMLLKIPNEIEFHF